MFKASPGATLTVGATTFHFAEHPAAPAYVFGQEGRAGTVYRLNDRTSGGSRALKVFKPSYRDSELADLADKTLSFSRLPGLSVCQRTVLTPNSHEALLRSEPDLAFAVLMPWIDGPSWWDVICARQPLERALTNRLAIKLCKILVGMEQEGVAHCDLSGPNLVLPELEKPDSGIELVDLEQMYFPNAQAPSKLTVGSPGYCLKHPTWSPAADRISAAILFAEILGWSDPRVQGAAGPESYFEAEEIGETSTRFQTLSSVLRELWGPEVGLLFELAWKAETPVECPKLRDWLAVLCKGVVALEPVAKPQPASSNPDLERASRMEEGGRPLEALALYRRIQSSTPKNSPLFSELALIIRELERQHPGPSVRPGRRSQWARPGDASTSLSQEQNSFPVDRSEFIPPAESDKLSEWARPTADRNEASGEGTSAGTGNWRARANLLAPVLSRGLITLGVLLGLMTAGAFILDRFGSKLNLQGLAFFSKHPQAKGPWCGTTTPAEGNPETKRCKERLTAYGKKIAEWRRVNGKYPDSGLQPIPHCPESDKEYHYYASSNGKECWLFCGGSLHETSNAPAYNFKFQASVDYSLCPPDTEWAHYYWLVESGDPDKASNALAELKDDSSFQSRFLKIVALTMLGRHQETLQVLDKTLDQNEVPAAEGAALEYLKVKALEGLGRYDEAMSQARLKQINTASLHYLMGHFKEALSENDGLVNCYTYLSQSKFSDAHSQASQILKQRGFKREESVYLVLVTVIAAQASEADESLRRAQIEQSKKILAGALTNCPRNWPFPLLQLANGELTPDQTEKIAENFTPNLTDYHCWVGLLLHVQGDESGAQEHFKWVAEKGKRGFFEYRLALTYLKNPP